MRTLWQYVLMPVRLVVGVTWLGLALVWALFSALRNAVYPRTTEALEAEATLHNPRCFDAVRDLTRSTDPRATQVLMRLFSNPEPALANSAAEGLAARKDRSVVPDLVAALKASDADVRQRAARVLEDLKDPRASEPLTERLADRESLVRRDAAAALGKASDQHAVPGLLALLEDPDEDEVVRAQAATSLGEIGDPRGIAPLMQCLGEIEECGPALARIPGSLERLQAAQADPAAKVRAAAATGLGYLEDPVAVDALVRALSDETVMVRERAAAALGRYPDPRSAGALGAAAGDPNPSVRRAAVEALGRFPDEVSLDLLVAARSDPDPLVRSLAVSALSSARTGPRLEALARDLRHTDARVREDAVNALGQYGSRRPQPGEGWREEDVVRALETATSDPDPQVRSRVPVALWGCRQVKAAGTIVTGLLADPDPEVRVNAAWSLGEMVERKAARELITALSDPDPRVRAMVAKTLGRLAPRKAMDPLLPLLDDEHADVRSAAAKSLGLVWGANHAPHRRAVEPLIRTLRDREAEVRAAAAHALGDFKGRKTVGPLRVALDDDDWRVRENAATALNGMGLMSPADWARARGGSS
jgi:HEAT repeat protein